MLSNLYTLIQCILEVKEIKTTNKVNNIIKLIIVDLLYLKRKIKPIYIH